MKIKLNYKSALSVSHIVLPSPSATSVAAVESQSPLPLQSEISTTTLFPQSTFKHTSYAIDRLAALRGHTPETTPPL